MGDSAWRWGGVLLATAAAGGAVRAEETDLLDEGRKAFRACAVCHCATDPKIPGDEDWLKMNETTACISAGESTPQVRKALNAYLRSDRPLRPLRIDEAYAPKEGLPHGRVSLPEVAGSAFLKTESDEVARGAPTKIRLHWKAGAKERTMRVPSGDYRVISYALYVTDREAATRRWMITATDINGSHDVRVEAGKTIPLDLPPVLCGVVSAKSEDDGVKILLKQTDRHGYVATLSRNGEVRLPDYVILDKQGKELHWSVFENT
jgi:hypothetical protein